MSTTNVNGEIGKIDSDGNVTIIYPITKAKNVQLNDGTDLETYLSNLGTSSNAGDIPVNPTDTTGLTMWIET